MQKWKIITFLFNANTFLEGNVDVHVLLGLNPHEFLKLKRNMTWLKISKFWICTCLPEYHIGWTIIPVAHACFPLDLERLQAQLVEYYKMHTVTSLLVFRIYIYIRKTYIDGSPKPQNVQIWKMRAFSGKCTHFMQIRWKCMHFQENACILCKLDENARIFTKNACIFSKCVHFMQMKMHAFSVKMHAFYWKCGKMRAVYERPYPAG